MTFLVFTLDPPQLLRLVELDRVAGGIARNAC